MPRKKKESTQLVQIQKAQIPPLRQSTVDVMSCPRFYVEVFIKGNKPPGGLEAARGTEIHKAMASYISHCARKGVGMDLDAFEIFSRGAGPQAAKILVGMRDGFVVDFEHLLATEIGMALDADCRPTDIAPEIEGIVPDSQQEPVSQGTLDGLYAFKEEAKARIDDFKSHSRPFDPGETMQGKMYSLFVFQHFPWIETVTFRLIFVRYKNLTREVTYTRKDVPSLVESVNYSRERQKELHRKFEVGEEIDAIPGAHCVYCPLLSNRGCPISEWNPQMQLVPEDRLRYMLWYSAFSKVNSKTLREYVNGTGKKVVLKDYNGKSYVFGPEESVSDVLPLFEATADGIVMDREGNPSLPIVSLLLDYAHATPDDVTWMGKIQISSSSFSSYLKAKARVNLHQAIKDTAEKVTKVKLKVSQPLDVLPPDEEEETEENEFGEDTEF